MTQSGLTYKPGDIVCASFSFAKDRPEDLPFNRKEELQIVDIAKDPNWAHAANFHGETGLIPLNYVQPSVNHARNLKSHRWYHGRITRLESEKLLSGHPPGSFLVRDSDLFTGDLTLCVVGPPLDCSSIEQLPEEPSVSDHTQLTNVQHYHIVCKPVKPILQSHAPKSIELSIRFSLDEIDWFTNLPDLLQYYSVPDSGLVASLKYPVPDIQRHRLHQLQELGWMISRHELILGDQIGRGEFGEVLRATYKDRDVAVKMYKKTACKLAITYEALLMTKLNHPNLVTFVGFVFEPDEDAIYLVTEYMAMGNLLTYLHSRTRDEIMERDRLQFCIDACRGLAYLEERHIVHRDVAARNILLSGHPPRLVAKVADFGMACDLQQPSTTTNNNQNPSPPLFTLPTSAPPGGLHDPDFTLFSDAPGGVDLLSRFDSDPDVSVTMQDLSLHETAAVPIKWTAPEAVQRRQFTNKSDVWSFGILMWEIYSFGRIPYPRMMANQAFRQILSGYRMKPPEGCPAQIYQMMRHTWLLDPVQRPTFATLLQELSSYLQQLNVNCPRPRRSRSRKSAERGPVPDTSSSCGDQKQLTGIRNSYSERQASRSPDAGYDHVNDLFPPPIRSHVSRPVPIVTQPMSRSFTDPHPPNHEVNCAKSFCLPKFERVKHL